MTTVHKYFYKNMNKLAKLWTLNRWVRKENRGQWRTLKICPETRVTNSLAWVFLSLLHPRQFWLYRIAITLCPFIMTRHEICHKHHKQRLCKIFTTRVKFHFGNVLLVQFKSYYFGILVISTNLNQCQIRNEHENTTIGVLFPFLRREML